MTADPAGSGGAGPRKGHTVRCRTVAQGGFREMNYIRALEPLPLEERLGAPDGASAATPPETLLAALGSCLGARIHANAASAGLAVRGLELEVEADVPASTMWEPRGTPPGPVGFESIRVTVRLDADASPEALRALVAHAVLWSPVANALHDPVHLDVALGRGRDAPGDPPPTPGEA